jgi:4-amino-4-deoxy-L-arabinose transferase-like glycosyltransferase
LVAAGIAGLVPTHVAIHSTVNNDVLLEVLFSAFLLLALRLLRSGVSLGLAGWIGLTLGLALLTKATALILLPVTLFTLCLAWRGGEKGTTLAKAALLSGAIALAVSGWWFVRNVNLYGEALPLKAFARSFAGTAMAKDFVPGMGWGGYLWLLWSMTFKSFWAVFGTLKSAETGRPVFLPEGAYLFPALWTVCVFAGLTKLHFQRKALLSRVQIVSLWVLFLTFGLVFVAFGAFTLKYFQAQGRYFFPAMAPIAICGALGWLALFPARWKSVAGYGLLCALALLTTFWLFVAAP